MSVRFIPAAVIALLSAGSAFADAPMVATLANPVSKETKEVVASVIWACEGTTCTSRSNTSSSTSMSACHAIAKKYGRVVGFTGSSGPLADDQLVKCNASL